MFENIGSKLKGLATAVTLLGVAASFIVAIQLLQESVLTGLMVLILGPVFSWCGSAVFYGLGQLIVNTDELVAQGRPQSEDLPLPQEEPAEAAQPLEVDPVTNFVRCPTCKTSQNGARTTCFYCGQRLTNTQR